MPKIFIKDTDKTSPGVSDSYANYSVFITGYAKLDSLNNASSIKPDINGIYEFTSEDDFEKTIGLVDPTGGSAYEDAGVYIKNYGNQMAYELLKLGYHVLYKPIVPEMFRQYERTETQDNNIVLSTNENYIKNAAFWEALKDKATYDFRFIVHGFLESTDPEIIPDEDLLEKAKAENRQQELLVAKEILDNIAATAETDYNNLKAALGSDECVFQPFALSVYENFKYLGSSAYIAKDGEEEDSIFIDVVDPDGGVRNKYAGFVSPESEERYESFEDAAQGVESELEQIAEKLAQLPEGVLLTTTDINSFNAKIAEIAAYSEETTSTVLPGRGDCIALIELDETKYITAIHPEAKIIEGLNELNLMADYGKYCAITVPSVYYKMTPDSRFGNNTKFPGSFHYLACFINSLRQGFAEWYAAAGYTRGVSSYTVDSSTIRLGEIAINALEPRNYSNETTDAKIACNVIAYFRGSYYLWGNRTAYKLGSANSEINDLVANHFLNIRQLCTTIKKQLYVSCRRFTFDPNSDTLWVNFVNSIRPTLELMKADQGVRDYRIVKVPVDGKKALLKAKIRIIPIEAVEDFDLEITLEDSFGETTAVVND